MIVSDAGLDLNDGLKMAIDPYTAKKTDIEIQTWDQWSKKLCKETFGSVPVSLALMIHLDGNGLVLGLGVKVKALSDDPLEKFTEYGIEGVVPLELLPPDVRSKYQAKPSDRSKRAKKEETRSSANQAEENQIATPASEIDAEGSRVDLDTPIAPMDTDAPMATGTTSQGGTPTPDDHQKQSSDTDAGQVEADGEVEAGMIDGETDANVDLVAVG
ncbi:hypothetical protein RJ639_044445 [Escallonia herrerae]|uniref:Uncharacterized protein n=1 Tax=Escallonia herrerae TaxID=1293975 RepID=A0AA88WEC3_9ASTE|nr:hypothetical protein RJ639_044445 [Escallonia herrerae]